MYKQTEPFTCGPSAYMEEFSIIKDKATELNLHELGRIKPSRCFLGISFLELNSHLYLNIEDTKISDGMVKLVFNPKVEDFIRKFSEYYLSLINKHKSHVHENIHSIEDVLYILDNAISNNKKILLLTHSSHWHKDGTLHWITCKGRDDSNYLFGDPYTGKILSFSKTDLIRQMMLVKRDDFPLQIVTD